MWYNPINLMTHSSTKIELLTSFSQNDAKAIKNLVEKLGKNPKPFRNSDLEEILSSPSTYLYVARESFDNRIIGMATVAVYRIPYIKKAYLDDVVVDESYRGHGVGSSLLGAVIKHSRKIGASFIEFTSNPDRVAGNKLYQKLGFKKRETNVYRMNFKK